MASRSNNTVLKQMCDHEELTTFHRGDNPWQIENPMTKYFPIFATQLAVCIFITRFFILLLKPLHQPNFVPKVIAIFFVAALKFLPNYHVLVSQVFPNKSYMLLSDTFSHLSVTYYMFLVGLEMDLSTFKQAKKKPLSIALAGIFIPFGIGTGLHFVSVDKKAKKLFRFGFGSIFWGITLTMTSFPDLARILSHLKLLHTEFGKLALTSAMINDLTAWILLVAATIIFGHRDWEKVPLATLPIIVFAMICFFVLRPGIVWMIKRTKNESADKFTDTHMYFVLVSVAACGMIADACGIHAMVGAFFFGLIIPSGEFAYHIMERTDEFVSGIMLPSYLIGSAFYLNFYYMCIGTKLHLVLLIAIVATSAKILSTVLVCLNSGMTLRDGISLGGLMNTKGVMALVVLNRGGRLKALDPIDVTVMLCSILVMTALARPIFLLSHNTAKLSRNYKQRTIQRSNSDTELRILTCTRSIGNLSSIINILEASNATKKSPISVFVVHLAELSSRAAAMLIVHDILKTVNAYNNASLEQDESYHMVISAFRSYQDRNKEVVTVQPLTAVSSFTSIHEEIVEIAEEKTVAMILVPFHMQSTADGEFQGEDYSLREVNRRLLAKAPCSVGILIDRGLGSKSSPFHRLNFAILFIGGPDDREALTYAWRMAGKPGVTLTVVRFLQNKVEEPDVALEHKKNNEDEPSKKSTKGEVEKELDDDFINEFRFKTMYQQSISYDEKIANNCEDILEFVKSVDKEFDLYIVGRGENVKPPLTMGLSEWGDSYPELGPIGDTLVSSNFIARESVLVVQQHPSAGLSIGSHRGKTEFRQQKWASPILNPDYGAIVNEGKKDAQRN